MADAHRFVRAAVHSWKIKMGEYGCSVDVVAVGGRWMQMGEYDRTLNRVSTGAPLFVARTGELIDPNPSRASMPTSVPAAW
jgi:hypothetical protein